MALLRSDFVCALLLHRSDAAGANVQALLLAVNHKVLLEYVGLRNLTRRIQGMAAIVAKLRAFSADVTLCHAKPRGIRASDTGFD